MSIDDLRIQAHALSRDIHELDVDRHAAELAFANRLEILSMRANDLAVGLQNYQPNPPTALTVQYGRFLHEVDQSTPIDTQITRWPLQVLQGDQWHMGQLAALKARSGTTTLRYATPVTRRATDKLGDSTALPPGQIPDPWMLRNSSGSIITRPFDGDAMVDVGNPFYQAAAAGYLIDRCKREGWDGVWLDEINSDPRWAFPSVMPAKYPTMPQWQTALTSFVNTVTVKLRSVGLQVWANLAGTYGDPWTQNIATMTDGHCIEFFVARGHEPTATLENGYWRQVFDWTVWQAGTSRQAMYNAQTTDPALVRYALATYLLAASGRAVFMAGADPYPVAGTVWTPDMVVAQKLGSPLAAFTVVNGLYMRRFEHGSVTVNPSGKVVGGLAGTSALIQTG